MTQRLLFGALCMLASELALCAPVINAQPPLVSALPERAVLDTRVIGESNGNALGVVSALALDSRGTLYVLDGSDYQVVVLDSLGRKLRTISRRGGGPGELQEPTTLRIVGDTLSVVDQVAGRHVFTLDGTWVRTERPDQMTASRFPMRHGFTLEYVDPLPTGRLSYSDTPQPTPYVRAIVLEHPGGRRDTISSWRTDHVIVPETVRPQLASSGMGHGGTWALHGDSLVTLADGYTGQLRFLRITPKGLQSVRFDSLRQRPRPVTDQELRAAERRYASSGFNMTLSTDGGEPKYGEMSARRFQNPPKAFSMASRAFVSGTGDVWIGAPEVVSRMIFGGAEPTSQSRARDNVWSVFPANGAPYRVTLPDDRFLMAVRGSTLYLRDLEDRYILHVMTVQQ